MSESGGGLSTVQTYLQLLVQSVTKLLSSVGSALNGQSNSIVAAIQAAAPVTSSQPANQFLASPSGSAGTPGFRAITQADLGAVANVAPVGAQNAANATSVSATTASLTAPANGYFIAQFFMAQSSPSIGASLSSATASLGALTMFGSLAGQNLAATISNAYIVVSKGQSSTFSGTVTASSAQWIGVAVSAWFVPSP